MKSYDFPKTSLLVDKRSLGAGNNKSPASKKRTYKDNQISTDFRQRGF
jgi:hypothetical protein